MTRLTLFLTPLATAAALAAATHPRRRATPGAGSRPRPIAPGVPQPVEAGSGCVPNSPGVRDSRHRYEAIAPDARRLPRWQDARLGADSTAWSISGTWSTPRKSRTLEGERSTIRSVTFAPDGKTVACVNDEGNVRLWDVATGALKRTFPGLGELKAQAARRYKIGDARPAGHHDGRDRLRPRLVPAGRLGAWADRRRPRRPDV